MVLAKKRDSVVFDDEYYSLVRGLVHLVEVDETLDAVGHTVCNVSVCCLKGDTITPGWCYVTTRPVNCLYCVAERVHR